MFFYTNAVYLPLPGTGSYYDLDITAYEPTFPVTAKFAVVLVRNSSGGSTSFAARRPDQAYDDYETGNLPASTYSQHIIPCLNGKISVKASSVSVVLYLQGYLGETDATYIPGGTPLAAEVPGWLSGSWATVDLSTGGVPASATFVIGTISHTSTSNGFSLRPYGSTETRQQSNAPLYMSFILPVFSQRIQIYRENISDAEFIVRVHGYLTSGYPTVEGVNRSTDTTGSYVETTISTTPQVPAIVGHIWNTGSVSSTTTYNFAVRKYGSTDDYYGTLLWQRWELIPLSAAGKFEQKHSSVTVDLYDYGQVDSPTGDAAENFTVSDTVEGICLTETLIENVNVSDDSEDGLLGFKNTDPDVFFGTLEESATVSETLSLEIHPYRTKENFTVADTVTAEKYLNGTGSVTLPLLDVDAVGATGSIGTGIGEIPLRLRAEGDSGTVGVDDTGLPIVLEVEGYGLTSFVGHGALQLPMLMAYGTGVVGDAGSAEITLWPLELDAGQVSTSGGIARLRLPIPVVESVGNIGSTGEAELTIELTVAAAGPGAAAGGGGDVTGYGEVIFPMPRVSGSLYSSTSSETELTLPRLTLSGVGLTGWVGSAALTLPELTVTGAGGANAVGSGQISLPVFITAGIAVLDVVTAVSGAMSYHAVNTLRMAITDYEGYDFNSFAVINGITYGATSSGIYRLDGATDSGAAIQTIVTKNNLLSGSALKKRLTEVYVDIVSSSPPTMAAWADETCVDVGTTDISSGGHTSKSHFPRGLSGRTVGVSVIGASGQVEEISEIELVAETSISSRKRR